MQKPFQAIAVLILCALWTAGCSSLTPARLPSAKLASPQDTGSDPGQSLHSAAVNLATEGDTGWAALASQAAPYLQEPSDAAKIRVGIKCFEPFVFINEDGQLSGFSVDL